MVESGPDATIGVIDYGLGNVGSVRNMLAFLNIPSIRITSDKDFDKAARLILPGVGAFDAAVDLLHARRLWDGIREQALAGVPLLGICLGMQLLTEGSEEGVKAGLGLIPGRVCRFKADSAVPSLKIPHMGWTDVRSSGHFLFRGLEEARFYFVHSYHVVCADAADSLAVADYGGSFTAACGRENIFGVQFHPEKSHAYGMTLLQNFAEAPCVQS